MAQFLLVVDGIMADGSDQAMTVGIEDYKAAMFGLAFAEPVHGYVWCDTHGWVLADESCVCGECVAELYRREWYAELCDYNPLDDANCVVHVDVDEPSCNGGVPHTWDVTDTQGHDMECSVCGALWRIYR
jgi:hypothetical protein